jgi:hypothetical protein
MVYRLRTIILLAMVTGSHLLSAASSSSSTNRLGHSLVSSLSSEVRAYRYDYTPQERSAIIAKYSSGSIAAGAEPCIKVSLAEIHVENQPTDIFFGENYFTAVGDRKGPKYWPTGYYLLENGEPKLLYEMDRLFGKDQPQQRSKPHLWNAKFLFGGLFPSLLALSGGYYFSGSINLSAMASFLAGATVYLAAWHRMPNRNTPGYDRDGTNAPRLGTYSFNADEATRIKDSLRVRFMNANAQTQQPPAVIVGRVHQILDEVVNTQTQYPVVYNNVDKQWLPSAEAVRDTTGKIVADQPRRACTDQLWIQDRVVENLGKKMACQKFEQQEVSYKSLKVGGAFGMLLAGGCALVKLLAQHTKSS